MSKNEIATTESALIQVDEIAAQKCELFQVAKTGLASALQAATAIMELRKALSNEAVQSIAALQGTTLGFLTDKKPGEVYPPNVIRDVAIEASLRGLPLYGNCLNVIGGRLYATKEGFSYLLGRIPNMSVPVISFGKSSMFETEELSKNWETKQFETKKVTYCAIQVKATWTKDGKEDLLEKVHNVKVNAGMGLEGSYGKAERKMLRDIYRRVTGTYLTDGDASDAAAEKTVSGTVVDDAKLPASAVVSESGSMPEFLKPKQAPAKQPEQSGPTDEDRSIQERVNSQPPRPAPNMASKTAHITRLTNLALESNISSNELTLALSTLAGKNVDIQKLTERSLVHFTSDHGWQTVLDTVQKIRDEAGDREEAA